MRAKAELKLIPPSIFSVKPTPKHTGCSLNSSCFMLVYMSTSSEHNSCANGSQVSVKVFGRSASSARYEHLITRSSTTQVKHSLFTSQHHQYTVFSIKKCVTAVVKHIW